jgi:Ca2+-transporting ATPase
MAFLVDVHLGLTTTEAEQGLARFGPNELPRRPPERWPARLARQLREPMAVLLTAAAAVAGFGLGERVDGAAILAIVILNALIGLVQEGKAAHALEALHRMEAPTSRVRRDGVVLVIPSAQIVPGDVVLISAGDRIPADLDLIEGENLVVDESLLTGESLPVGKDVRASGEEGEAGRLYAGTLATRGAGTGVALQTGGTTRLGKIAEHLNRSSPNTPLQRELGRLSAVLGAVAVVVAIGVFGLTIVRLGPSAHTVQLAFLASVALAVAAVPEGLATVVTVALALGVRRMAARGALVRKLPAVETLGSTTVIATDKTGTITQNRMQAEVVAVHQGMPGPVASVPIVAQALIAEGVALCSDATRDPPTGDPLEIALLGLAGEDVEGLRSRYPRVSAQPFDPELRRMITIHRTPEGGTLVLVKGAPEAVIYRCAQALGLEGTVDTLLEPDRGRLLSTAASMAARGIRVLALARRVLDVAPVGLEEAERELMLVALVGLRDPLREEAPQAVAEARDAGIEVIMVTGDHAGTARAVAVEAGLAEPADPVLTGERLRAEGIPSLPASVRIYARVDPEEKLSLVQALQDAGHVVAVTGDGVNDAPALRRADIGVAMGASGSDVAREAADMVITDDNLATIVSAVREGRGIYDNIRKVVDYLVAGNLSEITVVVAGLLLFPGLGTPLLPIQLLWINLLTDGLPALALGVDPVDPGLMARPPRPRSAHLLGRERLGLLSRRALLIAGASVASLAIARMAWSEPWPHARAVMFTVLVVAHLLYAFVARMSRRTREVNRWLIAAVASGIGLQMLIVTWPAAHGLFDTAHLSVREWALVLVASVLPVLLMRIVERKRRLTGGS